MTQGPSNVAAVRTHTDVLRSLVRLLGSEEIGDQVRRSTAIAGGATR